jgi:hypothetical protein
LLCLGLRRGGPVTGTAGAHVSLRAGTAEIVNDNGDPNADPLSGGWQLSSAATPTGSVFADMADLGRNPARII